MTYSESISAVRTDEPDPSGLRPRPTRRRTEPSEILRKYGIVFVLAILIVVASALYPRFLSPGNLRDILGQNAALGLVALGMTFVIIARGFDLSVGAIYALAACLFAGLSVNHSPILAAVVTIVVGISVGLLNGFVIAKLGVNPFVATLGSASVISGIAYIYSGAGAIGPENPSFRILGLSEFGGLRTAVWIFISLAIISGLVLSKTTYGRNIYSIGGNPEGSRLSGLRVPGLIAGTYVMTGVLAALAGMIDTSKLGVAQADVGAAIALDSIAVVIIGGTTLAGGEGAIWRTVVGLFILATLTNVFYSLNVSQNWQLVAKGLIIIGAVALESYFQRRKTQALRKPRRV